MCKNEPTFILFESRLRFFGVKGGEGREIRTMAAILHTSVLAPHLAPSITSGDRYCRVWMSFVK